MTLLGIIIVIFYLGPQEHDVWCNFLSHHPPSTSGLTSETKHEQLQTLVESAAVDFLSTFLVAVDGRPQLIFHTFTLTTTTKTKTTMTTTSMPSTTTMLKM